MQLLQQVRELNVLASVQPQQHEQQLDHADLVETKQEGAQQAAQQALEHWLRYLSQEALVQSMLDGEWHGSSGVPQPAGAPGTAPARPGHALADMPQPEHVAPQLRCQASWVTLEPR